MSLAGTVTVKLAELVARPPGAITLIWPEAAPTGTVAVICVSESTLKAALVPPKLTVEAPVRLLPLMTTVLFVVPLRGVKPVMAGAGAPSTFALNTAATVEGSELKKFNPVSASTTLDETTYCVHGFERIPLIFGTLIVITRVELSMRLTALPMPAGTTTATFHV